MKKNKKSETTTVEFPGPKKLTDLIMRTSDLELLVKKLRSLKVSEFTVKQSFRDLIDLNVVDFEIDDGKRITFSSAADVPEEYVRMFYEDEDVETGYEELLEEIRPLKRSNL